MEKKYLQFQKLLKFYVSANLTRINLLTKTKSQISNWDEEKSFPSIGSINGWNRKHNNFSIAPTQGLF